MYRIYLCVLFDSIASAGKGVMVVMAGKHKNHCKVGWISAIAICGAIASLENFASAQVVPDNTLGTEESIVTSQPVDPTVDVISGGATRGDNLFHSFDSFSVLTGRSAYLNNANNSLKYRVPQVRQKLEEMEAISI
ncbi:hypothetical protein [Chroococcidiopsis sp. CCALA 051]|mgnify:CR=1 FL=1|uniref:hypothetical protein n=1 Tax=Chroococcidiopsis sp. CCALA 051 TaxID=869949 RepID=UPI000D0D6D39|nr:hypothetical protein [Chroococcidiopsis sp. CCALA 051]